MSGIRHGLVPERKEADRRSGGAEKGGALPHGPGRGGQQSEERRRADSARRLYLRHGCLRIRQELAGQRGALQGAREKTEPGAGGAGTVPVHRGNRRTGQGDQHRSEPHRPHAPVQSGDLYRRVRHDPGSLRIDNRREDARLHEGTVFLQRKRRATASSRSR